MKCLNIKNKEVKAALDEVVAVLGDEDAAYYVISENNGHSIDKAPNGEPSKLFSDLLSHYNQNRELAIKDKVKTFTEAFRNKYNKSEVDQNGEVSSTLVQSEIVENTNSFNTIFGSLMQVETNTYDSREVITRLIELAKPNTVVARILPLLNALPIKIKADLFDGKEYMMYTPGDDSIHVSPELMDETSLNYNVFAIAHEIIHWYVQAAYFEPANAQQLELKNSIDELYKKYNESYGKFDEEDRIYGLTDEHEFIAELMTNDSFFSEMVKLALRDNEETDLFKKLVNFIKSVINLFVSSSSKVQGKEYAGDLLQLQDDFLSFLTNYNQENKDLVHDFAEGKDLQRDTFDKAAINAESNKSRQIKSENKDDLQKKVEDTIKKKSENLNEQQTSEVGSTFDKNVQRVNTTVDSTFLNNIQANEDGTYNGSDIVALLEKDTQLSENQNDIVDIMLGMDFKVRADESINTHTSVSKEDGVLIINPKLFKEYSNIGNIMQLFRYALSLQLKGISKSEKETNTLLSTIDNIYNIYKQLKNDFKERFVDYNFENSVGLMTEFLTNEQFYNLMMDTAASYDASGKMLPEVKGFFNRLTDKILGKNSKSKGETSKAKLTNLRNSLYEFISTFQVEMVDNKNSAEKNNDIQNDAFQRNLESEAKMLAMQVSSFDKYDFDTQDELNKRLQRITEALTAKLESRYSAIDISDKAEKVRIKQSIKYQLTNLKNNQIDTITNVLNILQDLKVDLQPVAHKVLLSYKGYTTTLTNEELISLDRNFFGFYCPMLQEIRNNLSDLDSYREIIGKDDYDKMLADIDLCLKLLNGCASHIKHMQVKNATNLLLKTGMSVNSPTIYNYIASNTTETDFEISTLTRFMAAGDKINDEAIKSLYQIMQNSEDRINHKTFNKATKLLRMLKNAGGRQQGLFELDDNGKPTGYIIRSKNYGKFHNKYKAELEAIKKDLGLNPGEIGLPENKDLRKEYNRRRNKWLSENCERKYTDEYYALFEDLSQEATDAREIIQGKIRDLTDKVKNQDGIPEFERLSPEDWDQLNRFYIEKKQLSSEYDVFGQRKEGIDLDIAIELKTLNEKLAKGMKLRTNMEKFEVLRAKKEAELSKKDYDKWLDRNTRVTYSEKFYEDLKNVERKMYGQEYDELNSEKREILNMFRDDKTGEVVRDLIPNVTINRINQIDNKLKQIRKKNKSKAETVKGLQFSDIAKIVATDEFNKAYNEALAQTEVDPMAAEVFISMHAYQDSSGKIYPKSYYSKIVPKDDKYIERVPSSGFSELSPESTFYNSRYDHTNTEEYYQPKNSAGYDNSKAFGKLTPKQLELRQMLVDTMEESNNKLSNLSKTDKYKMPQISGSMYRFMKSNMGSTKGLSEYIKDSVSTKGDDVGIHEKPKYAPDGTSLNFVPQYFTKELEDPSTISADLVGGVMMFFRMAENFQDKNSIKGDVEIIKSFLAKRKYVGTDKSGKLSGMFRSKNKAKEGKETNIYKFAEQYINQNLYNVKTNSITVSINERNFKLFGKEIHIKKRDFNFTKTLSGIRNLGTLRNLGLAVWVAGTGFFTAGHNHLVQMLVGRYYDWRDAMHGTKALVWDLLKYGWRTVGNQNYKSKQMALLDYFETGGTIDSIYENTNELSPLRTFAKHWAFGLYSVSDFLVKGVILNSVMYNYKNVKGEFICKEDYFNKYGKSNETKRAWRKYISAYDSIEYVNGEIRVKDKKDENAWEKAKFIMGRTAQNLGASADGMLTNLQKAQFTANIWGSMVMMHRQYIPLALQEKWTMDYQWDYTSQRYREAVMKTPLRVLSQVYKDGNNLSALEKVSKTFQILFGVKSGITDAATLANLRQLRIEAGLILAIYPLITMMTASWADKDKKNKWLNLFALIMARTQFESAAPYDFMGIARTVKNPTALFSMLDNWGSIVTYPFDIISSYITGDTKWNKRITRGAYKGRKPIEKAIIQSTPFKVFWEMEDLPSKRNYYTKQIQGN